MFRPRAEKLNENQLEIMFEALADLGFPQEQIEEIEKKVKAEYKPRKQRAAGTGRGPLPTNLPRVRVDHELTESERNCGAC